MTAGGATSWQELALYVIGRFCGPAQATRTAKIYLLAGHQDGQLPFSATIRRSHLDDRVVAESVAWIEVNYATPNPVAAMTQRSGLTPRTFARRFQTATGRRPIDYVHALRIEGARERLEAGDDSVDDIGFEVGYADPGVLPAPVQARHRAHAGGLPAEVRSDLRAEVGRTVPGGRAAL